MKQQDEFITYVLELMQPLGPVSARSMFGGYGIYIGDTMFALVADEVLYFKTNEDNRPDFDARGLEPFNYERNGKLFNMSYNEAPAEVMDEVEAMVSWAHKAIDAALKNKQSKNRRRKKKIPKQ